MFVVTSDSTLRSATGFTSASVRHWPAWRARSRLEETFKRYKSWTVDKERSVPLHTSTVRGYQKLLIRT